MLPIDVFRDGGSLRLADGFHRVAAARERRYHQVMARVHRGGRRDASFFALQASVPRDSREDRRTDADRRRSVEMLLADPEWAAWSDLRITDWLRVSPSLVARVRAGEVEPTPRAPKPDDDADGPGAVPESPEDRAPRRGREPIEGPPATIVSAPELTDDEYLSRCGVREKLGGKQRRRFDESALYYRRYRNFASWGAFKEDLRKANHSRKLDPLIHHAWKIVCRFINAPSPQEWLLCLHCDGTGRSKRNGECEGCRENGFV